MAWECVVKGKELADVRRDRRGSKSIEKYNVSEQAVYFETYYLPIAAIQSVRVQPSVYRPNHSCGRGLPVFKVRMDYGGEKPAVLMLEKEDNAERIMSMICAANPDVIVEEYLDPRTGEKPEPISVAFL